MEVNNDGPNEWWNSADGYGITRLFEISCNIRQDEEGVDQDAVDDIIKQKTKNKLYEIFIQQCPGVPVPLQDSFVRLIGAYSYHIYK